MRWVVVSMVLLGSIAARAGDDPPLPDGPVTLHARDIAPLDVILLYGASAKGASIVLAHEPDGALSGDVTFPAWPAALDWALAASRFERRDIGGVVVIVPKSWPKPDVTKPVGSTQRLLAEAVPANAALDVLARAAGYKGLAKDVDVGGTLTLNIRKGAHALAAALHALCLKGRAVDGVLHVERACGDDVDGLRFIEPRPRHDADLVLETQHNNVEEFRLAAVLLLGGRTHLAIVEDPTGRRHLLRKGTIIGKRWGTVDEIRETSIVVKENAVAPTGERIPIFTTLTLATKEPKRE